MIKREGACNKIFVATAPDFFQLLMGWIINNKCQERNTLFLGHKEAELRPTTCMN